MKILHILKTSTGAPWALAQIHHLVAMGHEITVMLPHAAGRIPQAYRQLGVEVIEFDASLPVRSPWRMPGMARRYRHLLESVAPDIIHCHFVTNALFVRIAARRINIPRLFQVPGPLHLEHGVTRWLELLLADSRDHWGPTCWKSYDLYRKAGVAEANLHFAYYASDFAADAARPKPERRLRDEFGIPADAFVVGMVAYFYKPKAFLGQFTGVKGHEDFIRAFRIFRQDHPSSRALIIGGPAPGSERYMHKVQLLSRRLCGDSIIFAGHVDGAADYYPELDVVVHPSRSENYGGCGESFSRAVTTIVSNAGGFPEFVKEGDTGYIFPVGNFRTLAAQLNHVFDHPDEAREVARRGQEFISPIHSLLGAQQIAAAYEAIKSGSASNTELR